MLTLFQAYNSMTFEMQKIIISFVVFLFFLSTFDELSNTSFREEYIYLFIVLARIFEEYCIR